MDEQVLSWSYDTRNDAVHIDQMQDLDTHTAVAVRAFFRRLDVPHLFEERVSPTLEAGDSSLFLAVRDRAWPPWGLEARTVAALCQVHAVSPMGVGVSPVYVADEDATNLGLMAAVYAEMLEELGRGERTEVNYLVIDGSVYASRILRSYGFEPSEDLLVTDDRRYVFHRTDAGALRERLGLDRLSVPELLAHEIDEETLERHALFFSTLHLASQPIRVSDRVVREIIWVDGGLFDASLPGGVAPVGPALPPEIEDEGLLE
ncbi:hypothetical protein [Actinomadura chokoriensis]|uniref:GNAT family N-acetyltransferase n=1 Tax=Actinomadura chokoriensis TaxID=454156 RepID=A0ABV4R3J3_9ACTN